MKTKIIKLNNKVDTKKFERKIWIYKSIIYKRTKFILENNVKNINYSSVIEALNIKNRIKRINYIYDKACSEIDEYNKIKHIDCEFKMVSA